MLKKDRFQSFRGFFNKSIHRNIFYGGTLKETFLNRTFQRKKLECNVEGIKLLLKEPLPFYIFLQVFCKQNILSSLVVALLLFLL